LDQIAKNMNDAFVIEADLNDISQAEKIILKTIEKFGSVDILIHIAASIIVVPFEKVSSEDLMQAYRTNLISPVIATQKAIEYMKKQGSGHIINVGSPGYMMGIPYYSPYVCSKAAFSAWTRTLQAELDTPGIFISEYFPGYIKTDSKPESRIGDVHQDFLMEEDQNPISKQFTKPKSADDVAKQLVILALKPRTLKYSGFSVKLGAFISNFASFRLSIARQMAKTGRKKILNSKH
jgi:short-subunit dehydrogenase